MLNLLLNDKLLVQVSLKMKSKMELLYILESHVRIALKSSIEHLDLLLVVYTLVTAQKEQLTFINIIRYVS